LAVTELLVTSCWLLVPVSRPLSGFWFVSGHDFSRVERRTRQFLPLCRWQARSEAERNRKIACGSEEDIFKYLYGTAEAVP